MGIKNEAPTTCLSVESSSNDITHVSKKARKSLQQPQKIIDNHSAANEWYETKDRVEELKAQQEQLEQDHPELRNVKNERKQVEEELQVLRLDLIEAAKAQLTSEGKDQCFFRTSDNKIIKCNQIAKTQELKDKETWPVIKELMGKVGVSESHITEIEHQMDSYRFTRSKQLTYTLLQG